MELLTEKFKEMLDSSKYPSLDAMNEETMAALLEAGNREVEMLSESTDSADIAPFTPILIPLIRRVYPEVIANHVSGIQPLQAPTGYIYSLSARYTNNSINPIEGKGQIVEVDAPDAIGDTITGGTSGTTGVVRYVEGNKMLVEVTGGTGFVVEAVTGGANSGNISAVWSNEALFTNIFKNYTGEYSTAAGEALSRDMKEIGLDISRTSVEAKTRKLKAKFTMEMVQDLRSQHGLSAETELMSIMSSELKAEIDRSVLEVVNANATIKPDYNVLTDGGNARDGRWEIEKYRLFGAKLMSEARGIATSSRRGAGNVLVATPRVISALEQLNGFKAAEVSSAVSNTTAAVQGTFNNSIKVVQDVFGATDYATLIYKGGDSRDSQTIVSPYSPVSFQKTIDPESGQPAIILATRLAITPNPQAKTMATTFGVNLAGSVLV